jgi:hypothetical protein
MKISAHQELIEQLRANNTVSRERLAALEADPIALCDFFATHADDFIRRKMQSNELVYKRTEDALVVAEPERHLVDDEEMVSAVGEVVYQLRKEFESGDKILQQRVQELEQKVKDLTEQLSIFNRVSDIALKIALQWIDKQSSSK